MSQPPQHTQQSDNHICNTVIKAPHKACELQVQYTDSRRDEWIHICIFRLQAVLNTSWFSDIGK